VFVLGLLTRGPSELDLSELILLMDLENADGALNISYDVGMFPGIFRMSFCDECCYI
jgi:hypothetical protein